MTSLLGGMASLAAISCFGHALSGYSAGYRFEKIDLQGLLLQFGSSSLLGGGFALRTVLLRVFTNKPSPLT